LALLPIGALLYGVIGAVQVSQGQDFKYWLVGDWVRGTLTGV
jgi:acyl CoA:acetate/3-ketoacid CoA transferase beta subunit